MATTPTTTTTTPPSTPVIHVPVNYEYMNESWCELQYKSGCSSTGSISHLHHSVNPEILEKLLQEAQRESLLSHPPSPQPDAVAALTLSSNKSSLYCDHPHHHIESSTPILVNMEGQLRVDELGMSSPIKQLLDLPLNHGDQKSHFYLSNRSMSPPPPCSSCFRHQKQIDILLEKQIDQEKMLINLRKEYEQKMLTKSPEIMMSSQSSFSSSSVSDCESDSNNFNNDDTKTATHKLNSQLSSKPPSTATLKRQNSSTCTLIAGQTNASSHNNLLTNNQPLAQNTNNFPIANQSVGLGYSSSIYNYNKKSTIDQPDWMKYWASRPQTQPPKEWNFVHPNSSKSKLRKTMESTDEMMTISNGNNKLLSRENIGKLIFTHMASFIVGATLMFLVLRRHLNMRSSIYFV